MNYIGKFISNFKDAYNEINGATLTGAIDAVVVRQEDGSFVSSPFHVRFGKIGVLRSREKVVDIEINGEPVDIHMKLGETGEAFFVEELGEDDEVNPFLGTSPLPSYLDFGPQPNEEDDLRSQDSGVEAEEVICKSLRVKHEGKEALIQVTSSSFIGGSQGTRRHGVSHGDPAVTPYEEHPLAAVSEVMANGRDLADAEREEPSFMGERGQQPPRSAPPVLRSAFSSSPSVDVPTQSPSWREELGRSKSLTIDFPVLKTAAAVISDGQGSKTDVEETVRVNRTSRRRRKKRTSSKKLRTKMTESLSSDNSTTSETADLSSLSVTGVVSSAQDPIFHMEDLHGGTQDDLALTLSPMTSLSHEKVEHSKEKWRPERVSKTSMGPDFHPFSDTDLSPPPSPGNSRSNTPVKSDTEYECEKQKKELSETTAQSRDTKWSWTWGELPTPPTNPPRSNASSRQGHADASKIQEEDKLQSMTEAENAQRSMLGNMFSFMRATKKARHNPESEGIYLEDLNLDELDPEVAALYFPKNSLLLGKESYSGFRSVAKDEDVESGNGTSLPQSPHSVEGAIGGAKLPSLDSDTEEPSRHPIFDYRGYHDLAFSQCGALHEHLEGPFPESLFLQSLVTYDDFCENPNVIDDPNLVVRLGGKYMNWGSAAPQIMSLVLFQRPLPTRVVEKLEMENMPKKEIRKRTESKGYSWFSWGRQQDQVDAEQAKNKVSQNPDGTPSVPQAPISLSSSPHNANPVATIATTTVATHEVSVTATHVTETHRETYVATVTSEDSNVEQQVRSDELTKETRVLDPQESSESEDPEDKGLFKRYRKTMRLSSDQIKKLNLRNGSNEVVFSVTTAYQGTTRCKCHIFLWNYDDKIVVSDIDGTITKSDVLGHILPIIGKDWAQGGVAQLFTKIKNNGYNFLYLSARAIGQARITRDYLRSIKQGDVSLPDGPLLLNPTSLIQAFHREVIERNPEEFKISCLMDIKALFPPNQNPFYAGYGNRINDVWAYRAVGIPIQRIFTINHKGELKHEMTQTFQTTYVDQIKMVDETFPPIESKMVPRNLLPFLYDDDSGDEHEELDLEGVVDVDYYDSDWEGVPTGIDAMSFGA